MRFEINTQYTTKTCENFCLHVKDGTHDSPKKKGTGKLLVTSKNIKEGRLELDSAYCISEEDFVLINKRSKVDQWDLLITMIGTVGEVCIVSSPKPDFAIKNVGLLKCDNELRAKWLYYYLISPQGKLLIEERKKGSTQQYLSLTELRKLPISHPQKTEAMDEVVTCLASLDDRITLLRETNTTLEAIAQALFKSWFIDFDPVHAKMQGQAPQGMDEATAALFPDSFEESELGPIPKGWKSLPFGELINHTIGGDWGSDLADEKNNIRVAIIRGTDIPDLKSNASNRVPIRYTSTKKLEDRQLKEGDLLLEVSGGSKDQPTGRSLYISQLLLNQFDCPVEPASFCRLLRPLNKSVGMLLSQHLSLIYDQGKTWEYQNQSTGIANFQTTHFLKTEMVVLPSDDLLEKFISIIENIISRSNLMQIHHLTSLRDTLLPRLISGQLEIPEVKLS